MRNDTEVYWKNFSYTATMAPPIMEPRSVAPTLSEARADTGASTHSGKDMPAVDLAGAGDGVDFFEGKNAAGLRFRWNLKN